jgi:hypothetical protein
MPTAFTSLLGLALPVQGEETGQWGNLVNTSITSLVDTAVAGTTTIVTDIDVTLTSSTGIADQARAAVILLTGSRAALRTVTAPARSKVYVVINATTGAATQFVGAGPTTGVTIPNGVKALVAWNGSDFVIVSATTVALTDITGLGTGVSTFLGTPSSANLAAAVTGETGSGALVFGTGPTLSSCTISSALNLSGLANASATGAITLTLTVDTRLTLVGNVTLTAPSPTGSTALMYIRIKQDATGGRTVSWSGVLWPGGTAPTMSSGANKSDLYLLYKDVASNTWLGSVLGQNY